MYYFFVSGSIWLYLANTNFRDMRQTINIVAKIDELCTQTRTTCTQPTGTTESLKKKINRRGKWKDDLLRTNKLISYPLVWYGLLYTSIHSTKVHVKATIWSNKSLMTQDLGRSVWSVKCQQTGVDIDNPTPHNSLSINWVRIWIKRKEKMSFTFIWWLICVISVFRFVATKLR